MQISYFAQSKRLLSVKKAPLGIMLLMAGVMTGCQTTSHLPSPTTEIHSPTAIHSPTTQADKSAELKKDTGSTGVQPSVQSPTQHSDIRTEPKDKQAEVPTSTAPAQPTTPAQPTIPAEPAKPTPTQPTEIEPIIIAPMPEPDAKTTQQRLLEQARQNSRQNSPTTASAQDGKNLPAFQRLMSTGVSQLRQGQLSAAQSTFTRAQRLAPQSSAVYFYLSQVALKQNQPLKAEAMARRGLVVAKNQENKKALWQLILMSAEAQGNTRVINEAKAALSR